MERFSQKIEHDAGKTLRPEVTGYSEAS